ncbi:MAG: hypothetical protein K0R15_1474 [Clostridiales bacterium]|nr:hypothetical protein [Clostridiales bacterium]
MVLFIVSLKIISYFYFSAYDVVGGDYLQIPINYKAEIISREFQKIFSYKSFDLLNLDISYPEIFLYHNLTAQDNINYYYQQEAYKFIDYAITVLRQNAIALFPLFSPYDAVMKYTVTLNETCLLSTYFDQYQYAGGAHGSTLRSSSNWNLNTGAEITLKDLFDDMDNYTQFVIKQIISLADQQMSLEEPIYFEDYKTLILKNFNPKSFYITPTGLTIYYQQYEVAPYAGGIREFNLSYESLGISKPGCTIK